MSKEAYQHYKRQYARWYLEAKCPRVRDALLRRDMALTLCYAWTRPIYPKGWEAV